jgi:thiamine biosynthesis lipoprotein
VPKTISRRQLVTFDIPPLERADHFIRVHRRAMACRFEVLLAGEDARFVPAAREALDEADRIEAALTVFRDTSDLVRVNRMASDRPVAVDAELLGLLTLCRELHDRTGRAFDVTSTPLSRCWGFLTREGRLPPPDAIETARALVGMQHVELDAERQTVRFSRPGIELNLGSIGKGYALGRMARLLQQRGVIDALLSAGGSSVLALGGPSEGWMIDLRSRRVTRPRLARLYLTNGAIGTSGAGEQYVDVDGTRYGHVLDPRTGWPASGLLSASVITGDAAVADALSTAFLVGGIELAERYCDAHPNTLAILTPDDGSEEPRVVGQFTGVILER